MAMTSAMEDVLYDRKNFNVKKNQTRHPPYMTEKHFMYHLAKDKNGELDCIKDEDGEPITSPRRLSDICIYSLVCGDARLLHKVNNQYWPSNLYPIMLSEALYQREAETIEWLIATWPMRALRVLDLIPLEDELVPEYLTLPVEGNEDTCLVDYFILGLLKMKTECGLKVVDFTGFDQDRKLCTELCRLPLLWMKSSERNAENIHELASDVLDVTKDKVQRILNRIDFVYCNIDKEYEHGSKIREINILLDLKMIIDDVPFGLALQRYTPFRFSCNRLWVKHIPDVLLPLSKLHYTLDCGHISHLEFNVNLLSKDARLLKYFTEGLSSLENLTALSLPNAIDVQFDESMIKPLNKCLCKLKHLQRLDLRYSNLQGHAEGLFQGMRQKISYLSLMDCRLDVDDMFFLVNWRPLVSIKEFNLSSNCLAMYDQVIIAMLEKMSKLTCFSVRNCQLSVHSLVLIARECKECSFLKVLHLQGYTPLSQDDTLELLSITSQIRSLQKVRVYPDVYAFPGSNETERRMNKYHMAQFCYRYLALRGRPDLRLG